MAGLIITNGDNAAELLRLAGRDDEMLPWRDVLHEGPIIEGELVACSRVRAAYLARRFRIPAAQVTAEFADRDSTIGAHARFDTIELWFEHDLYDQLQLVQVLAFLGSQGRAQGVRLVQADDFLGAQTPDTILRFQERAWPLDQHDLDIGAEVWGALAASSPEAVAGHRPAGADSRLPFMAAALERFLEELPAPKSGLGRTEEAILEMLADGTTAPVDLFRTVLAQEAAAFMGDWSFYRLLDDLASCDVPLIAGLAPPEPTGDDFGRFRDARLELTPAGAEVLAGTADHVALSGLDRWWAGTRLLGRVVWRYDRDTMRLVPPRTSGA